MKRTPTDRLLRAVAALGVQLGGAGCVAGDRHRERLLAAEAAARHAARGLAPGECALITGPSGAGKSTVMAALRRALRQDHRDARVVVVEGDGPLPARTVAELARGALDAWLATLARAGLAEAGLLPRMPAELSAGQRQRLVLARAMTRAAAPRNGGWLLVDEFASTLDRLTAAGLAASAAKWARATGVRLVAATAHDDVIEMLRPALVVWVGMEGSVRVVGEGKAPRTRATKGMRRETLRR